MGNKPNKPSIRSFGEDFPYYLQYIRLSGYSHFARKVSDENNQQLPQQQKNIIIGGRYDWNSSYGFYELLFDDNKNSMSYKSFKNDYNKKLANLKYIGINDASTMQSYLVQNNKYLLVFDDDCYNVYDMKNDQWLLKKGEKTLKHHYPEENVLINDEIIIGYNDDENELYFYFIGNNHITNPILVKKYKLTTTPDKYGAMGMCVIDFLEQESPQDKLCPTYKLKIILFGALNEKPDFLSSFLFLDVLLSYKDIKIVCLSIDENLIDKKKIKLINTNQKTIQGFYRYFGFECVFNAKNEPIIIIIGGHPHSHSKDIYLFNCVRHELRVLKEVECFVFATHIFCLFFYFAFFPCWLFLDFGKTTLQFLPFCCEYGPTTMLFNDKCIVMQLKNYVSFSLSQDLMIGDYGGNWRHKQQRKEEGKQPRKYVGLSTVSDKELENPLISMIGIGEYLPKELDNLDGIKIDYKNISNVFGKIYNYKIDMNENKLSWNEKDVLDFIDDTRFECKSGKHDGLIFLLSCHGTSHNRIILSDGNTFKLSKLFEYFNGKSCRYLIDKPKIFIVDCCRGSDMSQPIVNEKNNNNKQQEEDSKDENEEKISSKGINKSSNNLYFHSDSNFCFIFGNTEGYKTLDGSKNGGFLIRNVVKVFSHVKFTSEKNLDEIIKQIRQETKLETTKIYEKCKEYEAIQIVDSRNTIEDNIFFKPRTK